jgi:GH15 family glucan-1,4-alpha-glucosidase
MPYLGFLPVTDPRVRSTIEAIERKLTHQGFVIEIMRRLCSLYEGGAA